MADINIQPKKPSFWPWIVGIILAVALIGLLFFIFGKKRTSQTDETVALTGDSTQQGAPAPPPGQPGAIPIHNPLADWKKTVDTAKMRQDPMAIILGLRSISIALDQLAPLSKLPPETFAVKRNQLEDGMNRLQAAAIDPKTQQSKAVGQSGGVIANINMILGNIQANSFPQLKKEMEEIRGTAKLIDNKKSLMQQADKMDKYFSQVNDLLNKMSASRPAPPSPSAQQH